MPDFLTDNSRITVITDLFDVWAYRYMEQPNRAAMLAAVEAYITECNPELWLLFPLTSRAACEDAAMGYLTLTASAFINELGIPVEPIMGISALLGIEQI